MSAAPTDLRATPMPSPHAGPSPDRVFETLNAYQQTAALKAAVELDLFTLIGEGANTVSALAKRIQAPDRGIRILCDYLTVMGFLVKTGDRYHLTADSAVFLDKKSQAYVGSAINFLACPLMVEGFRDLATVVRSGRPLADHQFSTVEHPMWVEFARSMAALVRLPAQEAAKLLSHDRELKVLDVAAGHGLFGITIARCNPKAKIVALDFPSVLTVAFENATRYGVSDRYALLPGDALEVDLGTRFDAVLVPNLMHSFDRSSNERLLKKIYGALSPKGRVIVVEFAPNEDRISPRIPAMFALIMLGNNQGDAYTAAEHCALLKSAGFSGCEAHALGQTPFTAIVAAKP
jgi:2-polyprenyl-3-methyl-5-hydroxy-6-metoxy-1,4-benzoquinol methylase